MRSDPSPPSRRAPQQLLRACRPALTWTTVGLAVIGLGHAVLIAWILLLASVIDRVTVGRATIEDVTPVMIAMVLLLMLRAVCLWAGEIAGQRASGELRGELRSKLTTSLVGRDPRRLGEPRLGQLSGTLVDGVEHLGTWVTTYLPAATMVVAVPAMVFVAVAILDPLSTLILLFTGPMLVMLLALIGGRTADLTRRRFDELGWLRGFYLDMLAGLGTLKAFGRSDDGADQIEETSRRFGDTTMEVLRTAFQTSLVMEWAATAATALVAVEVSFRLVRGDLSYGTALAVLILTPEFFVPFRRLAIEYHAGQSGDAAATAILAELEPIDRTVPSSSPVRPHRSVVVPRPPRIELRSVRYTYPGSTRPALDAVDLQVAAGETLALVGTSGAGKSTIASVLLRFIEPEHGTVTVDGAELAELDPLLWRQRVAWVPQHPTMFSGTVAENIALGDPDADRDRIVAAAARAGALEFLDALPAGLDTRLGEGGTTLSGGQRQRIAIARAFLRDAPVVILDEFTSHLDRVSETAVLAATADLLRDRTAVVIAHQLATAASADRVAIVEHGHVIETGPATELRTSSSRWAALSGSAETP